MGRGAQNQHPEQSRRPQPLLFPALVQELAIQDATLLQTLGGMTALRLRLEQSPLRDAERAGERLFVTSKLEPLFGGSQQLAFTVLGEESGEPYGSFRWLVSGLHRDELERFEFHLRALLRAALNGPELLSDDEQAALTEALGNDLYSCERCGRRFLFFGVAREHELSCRIA